jgi:acetyl-CoA carboxylase carboxyl transferase subunit alpha
MDYLAFEQPIADLDAEVKRLEEAADGTAESVERLREIRQRLAKLTREIYVNLTPWQTVQVARHKDRPHTTDYLSMVFDEFVELHGDKLFGDDRAIRAGFASLDNIKVMVLGHQKGRTFQARSENFFGCAHPEGYRKAMKKMQLAAKFRLPVICLIDTPGAYPGIGAEERGQAQVIAENMFEMSQLPTPIVCVVIGEGGSGGALGIGVGDRIAMLEHSYYSVISPEGCAGILWKSAEYAERAAAALRFTSQHLLKFGVVDDVIPEPLGGAHRDHHRTAATLKQYLKKSLQQLSVVDLRTLLEKRYQKFRAIGVFLERTSAAPRSNAEHAAQTNVELSVSSSTENN